MADCSSTECELTDEWVTLIIQTIARSHAKQSKRRTLTLDRDGDVRQKRPNHRANFPRLVPRITELRQLRNYYLFKGANAN